MSVQCVIKIQSKKTPLERVSSSNFKTDSSQKFWATIIIKLEWVVDVANSLIPSLHLNNTRTYKLSKPEYPTLDCTGEEDKHEDSLTNLVMKLSFWRRSPELLNILFHILVPFFSRLYSKIINSRHDLTKIGGKEIKK